MALHYTRKRDEDDDRTVNAMEFMDRLCELNKGRKMPVEKEKIESTE
jgi:ubiquitin